TDTRMFPDDTHPGFDLVQDGEDPEPNAGTVIIKEITYDSAGNPLTFDAVFSYAWPTALPLQGEVMINASGPVPPRVRILSPLSDNATEGQVYRYRIWASGTHDYYTADDLPTNTFAADNLPEGLTVDATTGLISGVPAHRGTYTVTITSTNTYGTASEQL